MVASVIVVEETIADQFVEKFKAAAQTIKIEMVWKKESFRPRDSKRGAQRTFDYIQKVLMKERTYC